MPTVTAHVGATHGVHEDFLELVCADEQLLRAEFDAIIAEEWPANPPPAEPRVPERGGGSQRQRRLLPGSGLARAERRTRHPLTRWWHRQRSPPASSHPTPRDQGMSTKGR